MKFKSKNNSAAGELQDLGLRPATQIFNQIRYWSALDDPEEEKWDYTSHLSRAERKEKGLIASPKTFNARPLIAAMLIVLLLISVGTGLFLAWPYLSSTFGGNQETLHPVTAYSVHLGNRELGLVEDKAALEAFAKEWLDAQNAAAAEGVSYTMRQQLTFDEVVVDQPYVAKLQEVEDAFVRHAALDIA